MSEENLANFIKRELAEGFTKEEIKKTLLATGFSQEKIGRAFQVVLEGEQLPKAPEPRIPSEEALPYQPSEKEGILLPKRPFLSKKFLAPLIILVAFIIVGGVSAFVYNTFFRKIDPIALLPQETAFFVRVKINPSDQQVKNLQENLNKFPYWEKISQKISEEFEKLKKENPPFQNVDFTISDEIIVAWISPLEESIEGTSLIIILPDPDLKKLKKLADDATKTIQESKDWRLETETYKGIIIMKVISQRNSLEVMPFPLIRPTLELSSALVRGHFILAPKATEIKKVIDVVKDKKIKNITSTPVFKKMEEYLPKNYLALMYGQIDLSRIIQTPGIIGAVGARENLLGPLTASLQVAPDLPFLKSKEITESEKVAFAGTLTVAPNELQTEFYSLDLRKDTFVPTSFSLQESLAQFVPEKIGNKDVFLYGEGRDFKRQFEFTEKEATKSLIPREREQFEYFVNTFQQLLGVDLKKDILSWMNKNYAFFLASENSGKETPSAAIIFDVDNEEKVKQKLLKIGYIPLLPLPGAPALSFPEELPQEKITFSREIIDGFEIYSLPIYPLPLVGELGLNFSIREKKLIFTLTKEGLVDVLKSLNDSSQKKLYNSDLFASHFRKVPKEITSISYSYPYGYLGAIKWSTNFIISFSQQILGEERIPGIFGSIPEVKKLQAVIFEFLDRGVGPYLKVLEFSGSYSHSPEKGLIVNKGKLILKELSPEEKKATEEFWENIDQWFQEKMGSLAPSLPGIPVF